MGKERKPSEGETNQEGIELREFQQNRDDSQKTVENSAGPPPPRKKKCR